MGPRIVCRFSSSLHARTRKIDPSCVSIETSRHVSQHEVVHKAVQDTKRKGRLSYSRRHFGTRRANESPVRNTKRRRSSLAQKPCIESPQLLKSEDKGLPPRKALASSSSSASEIIAPETVAVRRGMLGAGDENLANYERRPRHKTKVDKYDLKKTSTKSRDDENAGIRKAKTTKRRRRKSGLTLNSEFRAPNVAQDRLTLKGSGGLGIFRNGKASSSVLRRGLPDLSFSEMKFLSKRQNRPEDVTEAKPVKRKKRDKGLAQQISGYFERPNVSKPDIRASTDTTLSERDPASLSAEYRTTSPFCEPAVTKCQRTLPNHGLRSRTKTRSDRRINCLPQRLVTETQQPREQCYKPHSTRSSDHQKASSTASEYSWSITTSRSVRSPKETLRVPRVGKSPHTKAPPTKVPVGSFEDETSHGGSENPLFAVHDQVQHESANESSLSQLSMDQYTKSMLLKSNHDLWDRLSAQVRNPEMYTLSDLKHLARLEKLEAIQRGATTSQDGRESPNLLLRHDFNPCPKDVDDYKPSNLRSKAVSCKEARLGSNSDQRLPMAHKSVPITKRQPSSSPIDEAFRPRKSHDPSHLRHVTFGSARPFDNSALAKATTARSPAQRPRYQSLDWNQFATTPATDSFLAFDQPSLQKHPKSGTSEAEAYTCALTNSQRIIHDIEQEELLAGWGKGSPREDVDKMPQVDIKGFDEQTIFAENIRTHNNTNLTDPWGFTETFQQGVKQAPPTGTARLVAEGEQRLDDAFADLDHFSNHKIFHPSVRRSATGLPPDRRHLMTKGMSGVVVQPKQQQDEDEESHLPDFWRPHILYCSGDAMFHSLYICATLGVSHGYIS